MNNIQLWIWSFSSGHEYVQFLVVSVLITSFVVMAIWGEFDRRLFLGAFRDGFWKGILLLAGITDSENKETKKE